MVYGIIRSRTPSRNLSASRYLNETGVPAAAYGGAARDRGYNLFQPALLLAEIIPRFRQS